MNAQARSATLNLMLVATSVTLVWAGAEVVVRIALSGERPLPLVYYNTGVPGVTLWCYDEHFQGIADYDLRIDRPYPELTYHGTEGVGPGLRDLPYTRVPMAIEVRNNRDGFRERPLEELRGRDEATLFIGDSFCFGQGVRSQDRLTELLEARWRARNPTNHGVVNLGFPSANIREIRDILAAQLPGFPNARRVVYVYTLNDPVRDERLEGQQRYINDLMHLREYNVRSYLPLILRPAARSEAVRLVLGRIHQARISRETENWYRDLHREGSGWRETRRWLADIDRMCRERDVEFVLAVFPLLHRLDRYPFVEVHRGLRAVAEQEGIHFVDLLPVFVGQDERELWVHPTDFHPNRLAHRLAAEQLAESLGL